MSLSSFEVVSTVKSDVVVVSLSSTEDDSNDVETQSFVRAKSSIETVSRDVSPKQQSKHSCPQVVSLCVKVKPVSSIKAQQDSHITFPVEVVLRLRRFCGLVNT